MSSNLKVPFGLREGILVTPAEACSGLSCMCVCPGCGDRLVANHTRVSSRRSYFSHYAGSNCSTGYESALHLAAKRVLLESKEILVPGIEITGHYADQENSVSTSSTISVKSKILTLEQVEEEVRQFDGIVPDIVAKYQGKTLFIEIAVTHYVDEIKLEKLQKLGFPVLEISLEPNSSIPNLEEVRDLVINKNNNRKWLVNPKIEQLKLTAEKEAKTKAEQILRKRENWKLLPENEKISIELKRANTSLAKLGNKIGHTVKGEKSFGVSNRLWQLFIYRKFILGSRGNFFDSEDVLFSIKMRFTVTEVFKESPQIAIYYYLKHLETQEVVRRYGRDYEVLLDGSIPF